MNVREFFNKFPTDEACLEHVMAIRYGLEHTCQNCDKHAKFHRLKKRPAYSCQFCGTHIYPCAGTPFHRSRTPLQMWFYAIFLFTTTRHGVPAKELERQLGVTYKTAWRMAHVIREHMADLDGDDSLGGHVELDETYVGGKPRGPKIRKYGRTFHRKNPNKTPVFGIVERKGRLMTHVVLNAQKKTLLPLIKEHVVPGARISTDELNTYSRLSDEGFDHKAVNHSEGQYVDGDTHTNTLECFWSHFKCSVKGTHRSISKKHMMKYLGEFEFRFNLRHAPAGAMLDRMIQSF